MEEEKLKPITFPDSGYNYTNQNIFQQNVLLKALSYTTDLDELKKVAKFKSRAEVLRTMDKLAIRKEFHEALISNGLDINSIVAGIATLCNTTLSDKIRLGAYTTLLKSLGLDKYEEGGSGGGRNWEDVLLEIDERERQDKLNSGIVEGQYKVIEPEVPEDVAKRTEENLKIEKGIYE